MPKLQYISVISFALQRCRNFSHIPVFDFFLKTITNVFNLFQSALKRSFIGIKQLLPQGLDATDDAYDYNEINAYLFQLSKSVRPTV